MAKIDAFLSWTSYYIVLPSVLLYVMAYHVFGLRKAKLEAFICNLLCGRIHRKFCDREKKILFEHMMDIRKRKKNDLLVLEIGVGSGLNFNFYPEGTRVTALDPNPYHQAYIQANLEKCQNRVVLQGFVQSFAEDMSSVASDTYDAVVCTLTLCTVRNPAAVLLEVRRVLKPVSEWLTLNPVIVNKRYR